MARRVKVDPNVKAKITKEGIASALSIFKYIKPYLGYFIAGMIFLTLGSLIFMIFPGAAGDYPFSSKGRRFSRWPFFYSSEGLVDGSLARKLASLMVIKDGRLTIE